MQQKLTAEENRDVDVTARVLVEMAEKGKLDVQQARLVLLRARPGIEARNHERRIGQMIREMMKSQQEAAGAITAAVWAAVQRPAPAVTQEEIEELVLSELRRHAEPEICIR